MCLRSQGSVCLLVTCLVAGIAGQSVHVSGEDPLTRVLPQSEWEARIEAALDAKGEWAFEDTPLNEVCEVLQEKLGIDVALDVKALEEYGIDTRTPVTRSLRGISNRSFLRLMLSELELTYTMHLGALWITTREDASSRLTTKVHPVGDLLPQDTTLGESAPDDSLLLQAITENIVPDAWDEVGGAGAIEGIYDALIVMHTADVHEQVAEFLTAYREIIANDKVPDDARQAVYMLGRQEVNAAIRRALDQPITAEFKDTSLKEVVEYLSEKMRIPIVIDVHALEDFGIDTSTPTSIRFNNTPLRFALARLLGELELTHSIRDEVLLVTTPEQAEAQLLVSLYPVRDLVEIRDDTSIEPLDVRCDFDTLIAVIGSTIAPDTWDAVGGPGSIGALLPVPTIVIAQTQEAHEQILELLTNLRAAKKLEAARSTTKEGVDPETAIVRSYPLYAAHHSPDEIVKLIMRTSEPGTWDEEAGRFIQAFGASIVVKHNASGHRQVQKLLTQLGILDPSRRSKKQRMGSGGGGMGGPSAQPAMPGGGGGYF